MIIRTSAPRDATFDRLGGFDGIAQGVRRLFARLSGDPALNPLLPPDGSDDLQWQVQMLLTDRLGGPMAYDGPDPGAVRTTAGIDADRASRIAAHVLAAFGECGAPPEGIEELRQVLDELARSLGIGIGGAEPPATPGAPEALRAALLASAEAEVAAAGYADRALFVLDPDLTLVHLNPAAERGLRSVDAELRRAFGLGAGDLAGHSILRFHPAPSQLQGLLLDVSRLPKDTTWCFGRAVWKARISAVRAPDGRLLGYAIAWRDESESHRAEAVFERLRSQAEDLPVPIMYPDPTIEKWFGNAACEHALQRLSPYLPYPVNPMEGVPVGLFLPNEEERRELFRDPARLPYKAQMKMGPETIAILVSPVLDQDQRYIGPQITWEIVHFTRPEDRGVRAPRPSRPVGAPPPAVRRPTGAAEAIGAPVPPAGTAPRPATMLRTEARALETTALELNTLVRLLDLVADQAEGQGVPAETEPALPGTGGAAGQAEAAIVAALLAVRRAAEEATTALTAETRGFTGELQQRLRDTVQRTQASAEGLTRILTAATGLADLRTTFGESVPAARRDEAPPA